MGVSANHNHGVKNCKRLKINMMLFVFFYVDKNNANDGARQ